MPYRALAQGDFPSRRTGDVLARRKISVHMSPDPLRDAAYSHGVFVQSSCREQSRGTHAAFYDLRPSRIYRKLTIGVQAAARLIAVEAGTALAVTCRANLDQEQIGGKFIVSDPDEACDLLLSFVEYAGTWIDPDWFVAYPATFKPVQKHRAPVRNRAAIPERTPIPPGMSQADAIQLLLDRLAEPIFGD